jgi:hypothetical protein
MSDQATRTSSEYSKKSPFQSHSEVAVNACTTACPEGITFTLALSVCTIQDGFSPVRNTPDRVLSGAGDVTKGISCREILRCSASAVDSCSSGCWISNAREHVFANFTARELVRAGGIGSELGSAGSA